MAKPDKTSVAVIGARGIGKHHAKWWQLEGAHVCAFAGTSDATVAETQAVLADLFGFDGRAYTDVGRMLDEERPDIVDVCSPPALHYEHVRMALEAGCHVLCEKPFVYRPDAPRKELLTQARELIALAESKEKRLGVCTQYAAGASILKRIWNEARPDDRLSRYQGHLASPARGRPKDPVIPWIELSPHVLSVLLGVVPGLRVNWDTLSLSFEGYSAQAHFDVSAADGRTVQCELICGHTEGPPGNIRHFEFNGYAFDIGGEKDAEGIYGARIETPGGASSEPDMMRLLIRHFLAGRYAADPQVSLANLDLMLRILEAAKQQS